MPTVPPAGYRVDTAGNLIPDRPAYPYQPDPCISIGVTCWPPPGGERPIEELMDDLWRAGWPFPRPQPAERPEALRPEEV